MHPTNWRAWPLADAYAQLEAHLIVPVDRPAVLATAANRTQLVELNGAELHRRAGIIRGVHISTTFTAEDWQA